MGHHFSPETGCPVGISPLSKPQWSAPPSPPPPPPPPLVCLVLSHAPESPAHLPKALPSTWVSSQAWVPAWKGRHFPPSPPPHASLEAVNIPQLSPGAKPAFSKCFHSAANSFPFSSHLLPPPRSLPASPHPMSSGELLHTWAAPEAGTLLSLSLSQAPSPGLVSPRCRPSAAFLGEGAPQAGRTPAPPALGLSLRVGHVSLPQSLACKIQNFLADSRFP